MAALAIFFLPSGTLAQQEQVTVDDTLRLFQRFIEDGAISPHVWLEGQGRFQSNAEHFTGSEADRWSLDTLLGLGLTEELEVGLKFGVVEIDPDAGSSRDGLSDIDLYAKYRLDELPCSIVVGGIFKLPTASEDDGLGTGKMDFELFGAVRKDLGHVSAIANAGVRFNGDPDLPGNIDGKTSFLLGGGVIIALTPVVHNSWELTFESARFEDSGSDLRLTPGLGWRVGNHGVLRGGIGIGLSESAPDFEGIASFLITY
jgi:hypothetical protein